MWNRLMQDVVNPYYVHHSGEQLAPSDPHYMKRKYYVDTS